MPSPLPPALLTLSLLLSSLHHSPCQAVAEQCSGQGKLAQVAIPVYTCQNVVVDEQSYNTITAQDYIATTRRNQREATAAAAAAALAAATNTTLPPQNSTNTTTTPICSVTSEQRTLCICRHDYFGANCTESRPIKCELKGPAPSACASSSLSEQMHLDAKLTGDGHQLCNFFDPSKASEVMTTYNILLKCKFSDDRSRLCNSTTLNPELIRIETDNCLEDSLDYWYDNRKLNADNFVISYDPVARVRVVFYDMSSLEYVGPNITTNVLTGQQLELSENLVLKIPNGLDFINSEKVELVGGRLLGEFQFTSEHRPIYRQVLDNNDINNVGLKWEVPAVSITYHSSTFKEPFASNTNGVAMVVVGLVLIVAVGGALVVLFVATKNNDKKKSKKE